MSVEVEALPVIDFDVFLNKREGWEAECAKVADSLHRTGMLLVKDLVRRSPNTSMW